MNIKKLKKYLASNEEMQEAATDYSAMATGANGKMPYKYEDHDLFFVESHGGEGEGDDYWAVFSLTNASGETTYWKIPGWYQSYQGGTYEYDEVFQVEPEQVMVRQWKEVK
jgi:hypothetical protein